MILHGLDLFLCLRKSVIEQGICVPEYHCHATSSSNGMHNNVALATGRRDSCNWVIWQFAYKRISKFLTVTRLSFLFTVSTINKNCELNINWPNLCSEQCLIPLLAIEQRNWGYVFSYHCYQCGPWHSIVDICRLKIQRYNSNLLKEPMGLQSTLLIKSV